MYLINEGFLEEDEDLNSQIEDIAIEVTRDEENPAGFECNVCGKACKSCRGLSRHTNSKHRHVTSTSDAPVSSLSGAAQTSSSSNCSAVEIRRQKLHPLQLKAIVLKCADESLQMNAFHRFLQEQFSKGLYIFTNDDAVELWSKLRKVIDSFKGDAEKIYSGFFRYWLSMFFHQN